MSTHPVPPQPVSRRWKPLRAGLVDLFYYDQQEFRFRDGRLLLRGNNGAGKSKVLALLMPFLLDGDLAPHRVEPDADPRKRMEWNLLLGGAHPHSERIGYTWMEFGRIDSEGRARFTTIGCGLKAVAGRGIAAHWYFVSTGRIGREVRLLDVQGYPLSRDRLGEQLRGNGERYDTATAYRRAVDEALFGLGERRYGALVDLLIRLRQPQLSKKPSEKVLSQALTESLPPLDQAILADVAEAFRSLQEDRDELAEMTAALHGTETFLRQYREYARVAGRRQTTRLRQAHSRYERVGRELAEATTALSTATATEESVRGAKAVADDQFERLTADRQALRDSDTADAARDLEQARESADKAAKLARDRAADRADAETTVGRFHDRLREADEVLEAADAAFDGVRRESADRAAGAALAAAHATEVSRHLDRIRTRTTESMSSVLAPLRAVAEGLVTSQSRALKHIRGLIADADKAAQQSATARADVDRLDADAAALAESAAAAAQLTRAEATRFTAATAEYLGGTVELVLDDLSAVLDDLGAWALRPEGESPARTAVTVRVSGLGDELTRTITAIEMAESDATRSRRDLEAELSRLREGGIDHPPARHTRTDTDGGPGIAGAPLWRLITFADSVSDDDRAGFEAALEAAGILDALVRPDGELRTSSGQLIVSGAMPAGGASLAEVVAPDIDTDDPHTATMSPEVVAAVLGAIGVGADSAHHTWVASTGRFRIGVLDGAWEKPSAQYIGAAARERFRRERIRSLESDIADMRAELDRLASRRNGVEDRRRLLRSEAADLPDDERLRAAHQHTAELDVQRRKLSADRAEAVAVADAASERAERTARRREDDAADAGLPTDPAALEEIADALVDYRVALGALWPAAERVHDSVLRRDRAADDAADAESRLAERADAAEGARVEEMRAEQRWMTLNANVGAEVAQLLENLRRNAADLDANKTTREQLGGDLERALRAIGVAEGKLAELTDQLQRERDARDQAIDTVRRFAETGLFGVALPGIDVPSGDSWAAATAIGFARAVDSELSEVAEDDKTLERVQRRVAEEHKSLADLLSAQGNSASMTLREDGIVADVMFRGRAATVPELAATLAAEVGDRGRLLTEREREVLENHLVDEVASALQELILAAEAQVLRMNAELESRPTSTGMRLRLTWIPSDEAPIGARAALTQLRRTADVWNESDRAAVGEFLQREIERVRAADDAGTWLEHLTAAFDYRRWNKFVIELQQRGQWRSATGPASGGERALAASVPLFAAASAHYASATNPDAPRLVMLDEAFAGVDDNARAKYLGLLAAFDLDVVMTSEREWGCYAEVPGLAIAQLARTDDVAAVLVTPWEWDGKQRTRVAYTTAVVDVPSTASDADGLF